VVDWVESGDSAVVVGWEVEAEGLEVVEGWAAAAQASPSSD